MNIYKRIISLFVAFAMCISLMVVPASANALVPAGGYLVSNFTKSVALGAILSESFGFMECSGEYLSTLWDAMNTGVCDGCEVNPNGQHDFMPADILVTSWEAALRGSEACDCRYCGISYDEFWNSTYDQYVSSLQTDLGTVTLIDGGYRYYLTPTSIYPVDNAYIYSKNINGYVATATANAGVASRFYRVYVDYPLASNQFYAPCDGKYSFAVSFDLVNCKETGFEHGISQNTLVSVSKGALLQYGVSSPGAYFGTTQTNVDFSGTVVAYIDFFPLDSVSMDVNSRPASIVGDYGIIGDNGTIVHIEGNKIVDETGGTVYNPATGETQSYTDYAYDYSERSYLLTLEDGNTIKVMYGDENVTIHEGDTVYNVYYLLPDSSEDPGGSGGSGDTPGTDDGSGWVWLQGAWTQMMDKLSQIREAIVGLELSPEINVDVEVNEGEEVTQESWFTDVLSKFSFLSSIRNIYSQLIADVTSDAATAAAVADGEIMLADVTTGHAATDGRASYTAPELAISFGSSDKYGVDWAGIRPLDLSWYAPYKETVDGILSGILWLSYLFLLIKRAPGIIRGSEMVTEDRIKIDMWRRHH